VGLTKKKKVAQKYRRFQCQSTDLHQKQREKEMIHVITVGLKIIKKRWENIDAFDVNLTICTQNKERGI